MVAYLIVVVLCYQIWVGTQLFLVGMCGPYFQTYESGGLWADFHQKQGLENWSFIKFLGFFDANQGQIGASGAKNCHILWKLLILEAKFYIYDFQMRILWKDLSLIWGSCEWKERCENGFLSAAHPHTPFSGECPPPGLPDQGTTVQEVHKCTIWVDSGYGLQDKMVYKQGLK